MVLLHFGQRVSGRGLMPSFARRLPDREFECFLFGTAIIFYLKSGYLGQFLQSRILTSHRISLNALFRVFQAKKQAQIEVWGFSTSLNREER
jgi:hypothetical protein